jgi:hypothetical protein
MLCTFRSHVCLTRDGKEVQMNKLKLMSIRWACLLLLLVAVAAATSVVYGSEGRWKLDGENCYWDPTDTGPDQCTPPTAPTGRWKVAGDGTCYFEPTDSGPDQCVPPAPEGAAEPLDALPGSLPASTVVPHASVAPTR